VTSAPPLVDPAPSLRRPPRSFVRREGRLTPAQAAALELLDAGYGIQQPAHPVSPNELFDADTGGGARPLSIEIGFGNGAALAARAAERPDWNFIGIEVHRGGVGHLLR